MLEALLGSKKSSPPAGTPVLGYNFNKGINTGAVQLTSNPTSPNKSNYGDQSAGYSSGLDVTNSMVSFGPIAAMSFMEKDDFTLEFWIYIDPGSAGYSSFFQITYDGGKTFPIRLADGGYGNRLQFSFWAAQSNNNWATQWTRSTFQSGWHHVALVREKGIARFYVDGVKQMLAQNTSTSYTTSDVDVSGLVLKSITRFDFAIGNWRYYMPEFMLWSGARYNANFTPPKGSIV